jgi:hypothetical protein
MDQELWRKVEDLLEAALEHPQQARSAFLEKSCGGNVQLRREVERLLATDARAGNFLERSALEKESVTEPAEWLRREFGPCRIESLWAQAV